MTTSFEDTMADVKLDRCASLQINSNHISFTSDFATLPANSPAAHAHIIDLDGYEGCIKEEGMIRLQDAVVTTLFKVAPEALKSFLSPTVHNYKVIFGKRGTQLVVWRKGPEVLVCGGTTSMCLWLTLKIGWNIQQLYIPASVWI